MAWYLERLLWGAFIATSFTFYNNQPNKMNKVTQSGNTVKPPNNNHHWGQALWPLLRGWSLFGGQKCISTIGKWPFGASNGGLCREVICIVASLRRFLVRRFHCIAFWKAILFTRNVSFTLPSKCCQLQLEIYHTSVSFLLQPLHFLLVESETRI